MSTGIQAVRRLLFAGRHDDSARCKRTLVREAGNLLIGLERVESEPTGLKLAGPLAFRADDGRIRVLMFEVVACDQIPRPSPPPVCGPQCEGVPGQPNLPNAIESVGTGPEVNFSVGDMGRALHHIVREDGIPEEELDRTIDAIHEMLGMSLTGIVCP